MNYTHEDTDLSEWTNAFIWCSLA